MVPELINIIVDETRVNEICAIRYCETHISTFSGYTYADMCGSNPGIILST